MGSDWIWDWAWFGFRLGLGGIKRTDRRTGQDGSDKTGRDIQDSVAWSLSPRLANVL